MSSRMRATLQFLVALVLLSGLGWLVYLGVTFVGHGLASLKSDVAIAIVAASASVTISIISLVIAKRLEVRASITQELRAKKTPIYEDFIAMVYRVLFAERLGKEAMSQAELMNFFADYTEKLTIWGSDGVIKEWRNLRMGAVSRGEGEVSNVEGAQMLFRYESLLLEIRKDLRLKIVVSREECFWAYSSMT